MRKIFTLVLVLSSLFSFSQDVVISQVYGGGGSASGTYNADYVELHNRGNSIADISGYQIMYGSSGVGSSGLLGSSATNIFTFPASTTIPAGGYILLATTAGTGLANLPISADFTFTLTISGTNGKVAFGTAAMVANTNYVGQPSNTVLDFIGYGTANEHEGTASAALSATTAALRNSNGCDDSNNNLNDFTVGTPVPRNSATPILICGVTPSLTATTLASFGGVCSSSSSSFNSFVITGTNLTIANITVGPLNGYTFSSNASSGYGSTLNITHAAGTTLDSVFVIFTPGQAGTFNGNIPVVGGGASSINVAATGIGLDRDSAVTDLPINTTASGATMVASILQGCTTQSAYGFKYSLENNFDPSLEDSMVSATNLSGADYSYDLTGLQASTRYYYVAYVVVGSDTIYGAQKFIFTLSVLAIPTVFTEESDNITSYSAILHGRFINTDCAIFTISNVGIEYSPNPLFKYGTGTKAQPNELNNNNSDFSSAVSGLKQNTVYYYRSYVRSTCNDSIVYGDLKYFKTLSIPTGLTVSANPLKRGGNVHYTLSGMKPGHYEIKLINGQGQLVLQKEKILQEEFMDANFILPGNITPGLYFFQVASPEFRIQKQVLVQ